MTTAAEAVKFTLHLYPSQRHLFCMCLRLASLTCGPCSVLDRVLPRLKAHTDSDWQGDPVGLGERSIKSLPT